MATKIKLTMVKIYEPNPDWYPEGLTIKEMAEMDLQACKEDPDVFFTDTDSDTATYEIIEEE